MHGIVVGGGVFGVTAALELRRRGWSVQLIDPGPLPHPDAASHDISKVVRADYSDDHVYIEMMDRAFPRWEDWNTQLQPPPFHRDGFLLLTLDTMDPDGFEATSLRTLSARGASVERIRELPSPWEPGSFADGYLNRDAGWAEADRVVGWLAQRAVEAGVEHVRAVATNVGNGVVHGEGWSLRGDRVIVAAGSWSPTLVSALTGRVQAVGQPILHFRPPDERFRAPNFTPWAGDITRTGWYGLPEHAGVIKVAHHGLGLPVTEGIPVVGDDIVDAARRFLAPRLPSLAEAELLARRCCLYADSIDGHFWIDALPDDPRTIVATGGSGHGFKFAPILGELIADVVEQRARHPRFAWREPAQAGPDHARGDTHAR